MNNESIQALAAEFYTALRSQTVVAPVTERYPDVTIDEAYAVSTALLNARLADGELVVGRKIGLTSFAVQEQLGVDQPDFGTLTDKMNCPEGAPIPVSSLLVQPKLEGEIAFVLGQDLQGGQVNEADVLAATDHVLPCFEIVDSRVRDWNIRIQDTIADNASCGLFMVGSEGVDPRNIDLAACEMQVHTDGQLVATGSGAAAMGSPLLCVAWLANALDKYGIALRKGDIVLSGSLVPFVDVKPGSTSTVSISGIGDLSASFV